MNWKRLLGNSVLCFVIWECLDIVFFGDPFRKLYFNLFFSPLAAMLVLKTTTGTWTGTGR